MSNMSQAGWDIFRSGGANPALDLAAFLTGCAPDDTTRCLAAAAYLTTLWQVGGRAMPFVPPSFLLVNAGGLEADPIDALARASTGLGEITSLHGAEDVARNRRVMETLIVQRRQVATQTPHALEHWLRQNASHFRDAHHIAFGAGRAGYYAERMDGKFGCVTDSGDDIILRLDRPADHERFRNDLLHDRRRLTHPVGFNREMVPVAKAAYVAGSLAPAQWDNALVAAVVDHGLPILFLPHGAKEALTVREDPFEFSMIANMFVAGCPPGPWGGPLPALPDTPPFTGCQAALRSRLRHFPAAYEFFILRILREFGAVASCVASYVAGPRTPEDEHRALQSDLHLTGVRAVALGVESLVYHGYGFEAGYPRDVLAGMLKFIRGKSPVAKRDVQRRFQSLDASRRDSLLEHLAAQGLVTLTDRTVTAVALADFVAALPSRPGLGEVGLNCAGFPGMRGGGVGVK